MRPVTTGDMMHVHGGFGAGVDYTVRLSVRLTEPVDPDRLRSALAKTQRQFAWFCVRLRQDGRAFYYEENPLPVTLRAAEGRICLNTQETNFHLWAVCWHEDYLHLDISHGLTDGTGAYRLLAALLHHYYEDREEYAAVCTAAEAERLTAPVFAEDTADPQDALPEADASAAAFAPAFTLETDGGLTPSAPTIWDIEIPEEAFIRFTSANDASPGTMISLLFARAVDALYPARKKSIISAYVINARPMLHAGKTLHNCLTMALFDYSDRIKAMPLTTQCTVYRGKTFLQSDEDAVRNSMAVSASLIRKTAEDAQTIGEKKQAFAQMFNAGEGKITFLVSYTGKWNYPALGAHMREFWSHPPNTFSLMAEISAANGRIFLSVQQRFREDTVREVFLSQLEEHQIPYIVRRRMDSDIPYLRETDPV